MVPIAFSILVNSSSFVCPFAIFMNRSRLTTLNNVALQHGINEWDDEVYCGLYLVPCLFVFWRAIALLGVFLEASRVICSAASEFASLASMLSKA